MKKTTSEFQNFKTAHLLSLKLSLEIFFEILKGPDRSTGMGEGVGEGAVALATKAELLT